jgi:hypothetical protein
MKIVKVHKGAVASVVLIASVIAYILFFSISDPNELVLPREVPERSKATYLGPRYLLTCLSMGRFGNQAEMLLGTISFAKRLNLTLVLPPFLDYGRKSSSLTLQHFEDYFDLSFVQRTIFPHFQGQYLPLSLWLRCGSSWRKLHPRPGLLT